MLKNMPENKEVRKLELCDIAPYLPYGLKMQFEGEGGRIVELTGITDQGKHGVSITNGHGAMWLHGSHFKPLLRTLSQLTQRITHNGKTFTPLVELNRMRGVATEDEKYTFASECASHYCYWSHTRVFYFEERTMSFYDDSRHGISPQLEMFQKLHEWHFDLYHLIDSGLAIPIHNTNNPIN